MYIYHKVRHINKMFWQSSQNVSLRIGWNASFNDISNWTYKFYFRNV